VRNPCEMHSHRKKHRDIKCKSSLHTGEVQGSIPCASTRKTLIFQGFSLKLQTLTRQVSAERYGNMRVQYVRNPCDLIALCSRRAIVIPS